MPLNTIAQMVRSMLRAEETEKDIAFYIQDTGLGIPEESLPHLFEKFFRVRENESRIAGTGLGLSICKQIIQGTTDASK